MFFLSLILFVYNYLQIYKMIKIFIRIEVA
jgi:hypothetical protein